MIDREAMRREALTWLGTPWRHGAGLKQVGVDCAQLLFRVFQAVGIIDPDLELSGYSPQFHLHRRHEVFRECVECIADELPPEERHMADIILYRFGKVFNHGGLVLEWPTIIHSSSPSGTTLDDAEKLTVANVYPTGIKYYRLKEKVEKPPLASLAFVRKRTSTGDGTQIKDGVV